MERERPRAEGGRGGRTTNFLPPSPPALPKLEPPSTVLFGKKKEMAGAMEVLSLDEDEEAQAGMKKPVDLAECLSEYCAKETLSGFFFSFFS